MQPSLRPLGTRSKDSSDGQPDLAAPAQQRCHPSAEQRRREGDEGLDELARISEETGLSDDEVTATRLRR